jgi:RHS repeat-associated protein
LYWHGLGVISQKENPDAPEYFTYDGLGLVRQVIDSSGSLVQAQSYDPHGNTLSTSGEDRTSYGYTGQQEDSNRLTYLRGRFHNPTTGRFMQPDPSWMG